MLHFADKFLYDNNISVTKRVKNLDLFLCQLLFNRACTLLLL